MIRNRPNVAGVRQPLTPRQPCAGRCRPARKQHAIRFCRELSGGTDAGWHPSMRRPQPRDDGLGSPLREDFSSNGPLSRDDARMWGEQRDADRLSLAADIFHCEVIAATLRGPRTPFRDVVTWQGLQPDVPRYVLEPSAGRLGSAPILFVTRQGIASQPSATAGRLRRVAA